LIQLCAYDWVLMRSVASITFTGAWCCVVLFTARICWKNFADGCCEYDTKLHV